MYISFDETPDTQLNKEREMCFTSGTEGAPLSQHITDALAKHKSQSSALATTMHLFAGDEPKKRLHTKVKDRLEQERKWVKHFEACTNEHKKGTLVATLKKELEATKKAGLKREQELRDKHNTALDDLRKECKITFRKEWDDEVKAKKIAKKRARKNRKWNQWWIDFWAVKPDAKKKDDKVIPAKLVAKELVADDAKPTVVKDRAYYLAKHANRIKNGKK